MTEPNTEKSDLHNPTDESTTNEPNQATFPKSVFFIIGNEFCERFSFYGMKAILPIYLTSALLFSENSATTIIHTFNFAAYFFSVFGGILSDNYIGKYKTILYLSIVYCLGNWLMSLFSIPYIGHHHWSGAMIALVLIGLGTGGIKPCVASFGGDQFTTTQEKFRAIFFSIFYFSINLGSLLSMYITPELRRKKCFGESSCYPLAFGVPATLMMIALITFVAGYKLYRKEKKLNNVVTRFFGVVFSELKGKIRGNETPSSKYDQQFVKDSHQVLKVFLLFVPICFFWALYDQQGSHWVFQAVMMKSNVSLFGWKFSILPEQMGLVNAFLILVLVPLFSFIYAKIRIQPLYRIGAGMVLCAISFVMAAILQFVITTKGTFSKSADDPSMLVCTENCTNILWQLPQYTIITVAEVLLSVTGLEFAYTEAPSSMKSVCGAGWLLTVAGGNLIVIIVTLINPVKWFVRGITESAWNFVLWTFIMLIGIGLFVWLARGYNYCHEELASTLVVESSERVDSTSLLIGNDQYNDKE